MAGPKLAYCGRAHRRSEPVNTMAGLSAENRLRDVYSPKNIRTLARSISRAWAKFDDKGFLAVTLRGLDDLGFGERHVLLRDQLAAFLPKAFPRAVDILVSALGPELSGEKVPFEAFIVSPQCAFVSKYGRGHFDESARALYEMTKRFTAEGDLRVLFEIDFERALRLMHTWCRDQNVHVRRLVSEGTRPRLPLAGRIERFQKDPSPVIELLEKLKSDDSSYVRRSVANNINDIAKDNPDVALEALRRWSEDQDPGVQWIVRHAARGLVKGGHPEAMSLFGCTPSPRVDVESAVHPAAVDRGGTILLTCVLKSRSAAPQKLIVDYAIFYQKANGRMLPKVFKGRNLSLDARETKRFEKRIALKQTSGRTIYPGPHALELRLNGKAYGRHDFIVR